MQFAEEHWGEEEVRRYLRQGKARDESLVEQVDRLDDQLQAVEARLGPVDLLAQTERIIERLS